MHARRLVIMRAPNFRASGDAQEEEEEEEEEEEGRH